MGTRERGAGGKAAARGRRQATGQKPLSAPLAPGGCRLTGDGTSGCRNFTTALSQEQGSAKNLASQENVSITGHRSSKRGHGGRIVQCPYLGGKVHLEKGCIGVLMTSPVGIWLLATPRTK